MKDMVNKIGKKLKRYFRVWWIMSRNSFQVVLTRRKLFFIFFTGKVLRFAFFLGFLFFLVKGSSSIAGYSFNEIVFFFLTFNLVDVLAQFFFREVYRFRHMVVSGNLDYVLIKPVSALFRSLMGGADIIDLITIPPLIYAIIYVGKMLNPTSTQVIFFAFLVLNGLMIAMAFHILVLALAVITLEIDHSIMIYRDITNLGRLPIDIYKEPLKGILTFLIPVGIMITLPAKALMGFVSLSGVLGSLMLGSVLIFLSTKFWNSALKKYTSASS